VETLVLWKETQADAYFSYALLPVQCGTNLGRTLRVSADRGKPLSRSRLPFKMASLKASWYNTFVLGEPIVKSNVSLTLRPSLSVAIRPSCVVGVLYIILLFFVILTRGYGALDFVHLGAVWAKYGPAGTWGYDGQFYYQLAGHPIHAYQYMDNAPYRYQRIFYPLVVAVFSLGLAPLIPYMMVLVNGLAIVLSVEIMSRLLAKQQLSSWLSLPVGLYFGQAAAFLFDTAEPFALFLVCAGFWFIVERRIPWAALCMGLAALTRETSVIFAGGYVAYFLWRKEWRSAALFTGLGVLPILLWLLALRLIFGRTGITFAPAFEHAPFAGLFYYSSTPRKFLLLIIFMLLPTIMSCLLALSELMHRRWQHLALLGIWLANLCTIVFLSHESYADLISCGRIAGCVVVPGLFYGVMTRNKTILCYMQYYVFTFFVFFVCIWMHINSFII
jgi:hypothetical protein